jgi:RNA polymerase-binding transcription factor DksA
MEKNTDVLDQAAYVTEVMTEKAVAYQREFAKPEKHPDFDGKHCVEADCGVAIPKERLKLGKVRCVDCQSRLESIAKRFGSH